MQLSAASIPGCKCSSGLPTPQQPLSRLSAARRSQRHPIAATGAQRAVIEEPPPPAKVGGGGTGLLERPGLDLTDLSGAPRTEAGMGAENPNNGDKLGGGSYRVLLLDDPKHTEQLVVKVVTRVVPDVDELKAKNAFETSRQLGQAIITTALKEHAEFYASQIFRNGVRSTIEPDSTVI